MWYGFQAKKLDIHREHEPELAENWAEPKNKAGLVTGPDPEPKKIQNFNFKKSNPQLCSFTT